VVVKSRFSPNCLGRIFMLSHRVFSKYCL